MIAAPQIILIVLRSVLHDGKETSPQRSGGIGTHLPLVLAIRHQAPLRAAIRPSLCLRQLYTHSRFLFIRIGNLQGKNRSFYDPYPHWRYGFELCFHNFCRFVGSKSNPDFGCSLNDCCWCYICTVRKLLGSACCSCDWCYKSEVGTQLKICMHPTSPRNRKHQEASNLLIF
jgi:hypothetical protein